MSSPCFAMHFLVLFHFCNDLAEEGRAGCVNCLFAVEWLWCSSSLPHDVIVVFPGHTHLFFEVCT